MTLEAEVCEADILLELAEEDGGDVEYVQNPVQRAVICDMYGKGWLTFSIKEGEPAGRRAVCRITSQGIEEARRRFPMGRFGVGWESSLAWAEHLENDLEF